MLFFLGGIVLDRFGKIRCFYNCSDGFSRHLTNVADSFSWGGEWLLLIYIDLSIFFSGFAV